jgi:hypothetical protein
LLADQLDASFLSRNSNGDEDEPASTDPDDEETYESYGRHLARVCGPFDRIHVIVEHGVRIALAASDDEAARRPPTDRKYVVVIKFVVLCFRC